jgi:hypothetical protein
VGEDSGPFVRVAWRGGRWRREENVQSHDANRGRGGVKGAQIRFKKG